MADFKNERVRFHRYYTKEGIDQMRTLINPGTNLPIHRSDINYYIAQLDDSMQPTFTGSGARMSGGAKRRLLNAEQYRTYAHVLYEHRKLMAEIRPILESIFLEYPAFTVANPVEQLAAVEHSSFQWVPLVHADMERLVQHRDLLTDDEFNKLNGENIRALTAYAIIVDEQTVQNARNFSIFRNPNLLR